MRVIGHRGLPAAFPENTVVGLRRAASRCDWVEFDVRRCASGEPVVVHDDTLDRVLGLDRPVAETTLGEIRSRYVDDSDERVPTLPEAAVAVPPDTTLNVELKSTGVAEQLVETAEAVGNETVVSSFSAELLRRMDAVSDLPLAPIVADADAWDDALALADEVGAEYVHPNYELVLAKPERVADAHDRDLEVNTWTLRSPDPFDRLSEIDVDGVFVDDPTYARR